MKGVSECRNTSLLSIRDATAPTSGHSTKPSKETSHSRRKVHWGKEEGSQDNNPSDDSNNNPTHDISSSSSATLLVETIGALLTPASELSEEEIAATWYLRQEYAAQKCLARQIADDIRSREPPGNATTGGYVDTVAQVYTACSMDNELGPSERDLDKLQHWTRVAHSRRGLEQWSVSQISLQRRRRRFALTKTILCNQERLNHLGPDAKAEMLRLCSLRISTSANRFAAAMAYADAVAADHSAANKEQLL